MDGRRYGQMLVSGFSLLLISLLSAWAVQRGGEAVEPAPVDAMLEESAAAPETSAEATPVASAASWDLPVTWNDRVAFWVDFLEGRNADKTRLWLERKSRYEGMIRQKLRERGMPEDLIYLAMIESGFSARAYSHAHASGLWQFIAETGGRYGLEVSPYVDERRDPVEATDAALDYLQELHERFGSWYLAAASYNTGENRVARILRERVGVERGGDSLFWKIDQHLPRETRDYVPLMLAAGHIGKDPEKYGFSELAPQDPLVFEVVAVPGGTALETVARASGLDAETVQDLNPHLVRGVTPPNREWGVRLPIGRSVVFARNFERVRDEVRLATTEHVVRRGETLSHIARRYGVSVSDLRAANGGLDPRRLQAGRNVTVPVRSAGQAAVAQAQAASSPSYYQVRRGDTLWEIARRSGTSVRQIQAWNGLGRRSGIRPGQRLRIG